MEEHSCHFQVFITFFYSLLPLIREDQIREVVMLAPKHQLGKFDKSEGSQLAETWTSHCSFVIKSVWIDVHHFLKQECC